MTLLETRSLSKSFGGVRAVDDVSFTVNEREIVALIGPNGAGKTTCFNILNGNLAPDGGSVLLDGRVITGLPPRHDSGRQGALILTASARTTTRPAPR